MSKFRVGDIVKTRDGREVEILKTDLDSYTPIVGVIHLAPHGGKIVKQWKADGSIFDGPTDWNLIPPKRTREVTVFLNIGPTETNVFNTASEADSWARHAYGEKPLAVAVPATFTIEY